MVSKSPRVPEKSARAAKEAACAKVRMSGQERAERALETKAKLEGNLEEAVRILLFPRPNEQARRGVERHTDDGEEAFCLLGAISINGVAFDISFIQSAVGGKKMGRLVLDLPDTIPCVDLSQDGLKLTDYLDKIEAEIRKVKVRFASFPQESIRYFSIADSHLMHVDIELELPIDLDAWESGKLPQDIPARMLRDKLAAYGIQ